ncbi:MAG: hypothetical protein ACOYKE_00930 [Ferruginibacter sp.]
MKKYILVCSILFSAFQAIAQDTVAIKQAEIKPVELINTSSRAVMLLSNFFNEEITAELLKQISAEKLEEVKASCNLSDYPNCIQDSLEKNHDRESEYFKTLKIYQIATFDNFRNGESFGRESILWVPAAENSKADGTCTFTKDFYIVIPTKDIRLL